MERPPACWRRCGGLLGLVGGHGIDRAEHRGRGREAVIAGIVGRRGAGDGAAEGDGDSGGLAVQHLPGQGHFMARLDAGIERNLRGNLRGRRGPQALALAVCPQRSVADASISPEPVRSVVTRKLPLASVTTVSFAIPLIVTVCPAASMSVSVPESVMVLAVVLWTVNVSDGAAGAGSRWRCWWTPGPSPRRRPRRCPGKPPR